MIQRNTGLYASRSLASGIEVIDYIVIYPSIGNLWIKT